MSFMETIQQQQKTLGIFHTGFLYLLRTNKEILYKAGTIPFMRTISISISMTRRIPMKKPSALTGSGAILWVDVLFYGQGPATGGATLILKPTKKMAMALTGPSGIGTLLPGMITWKHSLGSVATGMELP